MQAKDLIEAYAAGKQDFSDANLHGADLRDANLRRSDLRGTNLTGADLRGANLCDANLYGASLHGTNLTGADLRGANLTGADLHGTNLHGASLHGAKIDPRVITKMQIVPAAGDLHVWKKMKNGVICSLIIPDGTPRVGGVVGRKCRAELAVVVSGSGVSMRDGKTEYAPGVVVVADAYDPNPLIECAGGIHFFLTREEAEDYS